MANIAQTVNVLQAMILTDKEKMLLTPTYHVFEMFKVHQGGTVPAGRAAVARLRVRAGKIPTLSASATRAADGSAVHLSLANTSPAQPYADREAGRADAEVGRRARADRDGDERAQHVRGAERGVACAFTGATVKGDTLEVKVPAKSVVVLALK